MRLRTWINPLRNWTYSFHQTDVWFRVAKNLVEQKAEKSGRPHESTV
jgi:hypothetical protein